METVIEVKHLTKDFGSGRGIFDMNFAIKKGEVFGFLGPNGAGKTTTIRHLMGFTQPQKGTTAILGLDSSKQYHQIMKDVGYLPGEIALPEGLSGWQFIRMMQKLRKSTNETYLNYLLEKFQLDPSGSTKKMSLGNKRKLAVVTAFMDDPAVLILDEPTSGLDPVMQEIFIDYLIGEKKRGKTILLSSHIFSEIEATCDRIAIIKDGHLVSEVDAAAIKNTQRKEFALRLGSINEAEQLQANLARVGIVGERDQRKFHVTLDKQQLNLFFAQMTWVHVETFKELKFSLESYFLKFYQSDKTMKELA